MQGIDPPEPDPHDPVAPRRDAHRFRRALWASVGFVLFLAWVHGLQQLFGESLTGLGVRPGNPWGLVGVLTAPLIHGSWEHLIANTLPLLVLGTLALYAYPRASARALPLMWLGAGLGTWLIGRDSVHFGASGVAHGLMFFLFVLGALRWDRRAIAVALVSFFLFGTMVLTVLPREAGISWESHLAGAVFGALAAVLWRKLDPAPPRRKYSWELEEEWEARQAEAARDEFELPRPGEVPVLWHRPEPEASGGVIPFRPRSGGGADTSIGDEPPTPTRH